MSTQTTPNDGGPAFPVCTDFSRVNEGMTLRDYFAAAALQGLLADSELKYKWDEFAQASYSLADSMLAARDGKGGAK